MRGKDTIVTIPVGYSDGLSKKFEQKYFVLIRGKLYKIVAVCMDQSMIDLKGVQNNLEVGDEVVILGKQQKSFIDPELTAIQIGIDVEELLCQISVRIPRIFLD